MSVAERLQDERFYEYLYAVLTSWGMHRMGATSTKLVDFVHFRQQIQSAQEEMKTVAKLNLANTSEALQALDSIEHIMNQLKVSASSAHLVANSKVLHHILPDLMLPIDRRYTLSYFHLNQTLPSQKEAGSIVRYLFPLFARIAAEKKAFIHSAINLKYENWDTSLTKVIDNAVIGAGLA